MNILVTGGAGYIGSHTCVELLDAGHSVVVVDDFSNSSPQAPDRVERITGKSLKFYKADVKDENALREIFAQNKIDAVVHFAGCKAVGESVSNPIKYYENNVGGTITLCRIMGEHGCKKLVFSSSATVYGTPDRVPVSEDCRRGNIASPYGRTKAMAEDILKDAFLADGEWGIMLLRYFNPIGAHKSGLIGENPLGRPNNLLPALLKAVGNEGGCLDVFGNDYNTPDGTGIRDYIHVVDLAKGHVKALEKLEECNGTFVYNLGTGKGCSVLELIKTFESTCGVNVNYRFAPRRPGDIACYYADPSKAQRELCWEARLTIEDMCRDAWRFYSQNPKGY